MGNVHEIRPLSSSVIDQIAAGEVVDRPSSIVKELIENSLDAGANAIDVVIEQGGLRSIRVTDDGFGIPREQLKNAVQRHATSKLREADDLLALATKGFRGEALASMGAVSTFQIMSRTQDARSASMLRVNYGKASPLGELGMRVGTTVRVDDLFEKTPARKKFLRAPSTESAWVHEVVQKMALAHGHVAFKLTNNGRVVLDLPKHDSLSERMAALLGAGTGSSLSIANGQEHNIEVIAIVAPPEKALSTSKQTSLFVGRRWIKDRNLLHSVKLGYGEMLPKGRFPIASVFLSIPFGEVDYNVHPQKTEVRFAYPGQVAAAIRRTVRKAVSQRRMQQAEHQTFTSIPSGVRPKHTEAFGRGVRQSWSGGYQQLSPAGQQTTLLSTSRETPMAEPFFARGEISAGESQVAYGAAVEKNLEPAGRRRQVRGTTEQKSFALASYDLLMETEEFWLIRVQSQNWLIEKRGDTDLSQRSQEFLQDRSRSIHVTNEVLKQCFSGRSAK